MRIISCGELYDVMLARVKLETEKLLWMLTGEFGMDPKSIELVFSGGRGYHVHVKDLAFRNWGSAERRELIDYVCGIGLDPALMLTGKLTGKPGWPARFRAALIDYLMWIGTLSPEGCDGAPHRDGRRRKGICVQFPEKPGRSHHSDQGNFPTGKILNDRVLSAVTSQQDGEFKTRPLDKAALADEPVTTDTKRLIRLPTSLHGGSGMRVQPLEPRELHEFDPLVDAVVFGTRDIKIDFRFKLTMPMLGSTYESQKGITTVPEAIAVFLCARGAAEIS